MHDIEFATEISTSLLAQVRQLQALLAEREETLKSVNLEKSRLEIEAEAYAQRIRALDDSEQRYKDENWALETQTHELMATIRESTEREKKLSSSLSTSTSEKSAVEREVEELRQTNSRLLEDQSVTQKANDAELNLLRRNLNAGDAEKSALHKKLHELTSQNQELAKAVAMRIRQHESQGSRELPDDDEGDEPEQTTPDNSPPTSPNKFTPRHNLLESETLKSSLGHAHRMIQNLKSTIHREKTEKIELKRMLQDARDEVEQRRRESSAPNGSNKRLKKKDESFRKSARPDLLGAGRKEQSFVELHDTDWEDNASQLSPTRSAVPASARARAGADSPDQPSDVYQTATEAEEGFETANERATATESEAFQTGVESMADDSSDSAELTETENSIQTTPRNRAASSLVMAKTRDRVSYHSSASTSDDDDEDQDGGFTSPTQMHISRPRVRSKRSVLRRVRPSGEAPMASGSRPTSARNSPAPNLEPQPQAQEGQSLFAELAELEGTEYEEDNGVASGASTPRMEATSNSRRPSEAMLDTSPKPAMVDSGVMTEPWEPTPSVAVPIVGEAVLRDAPTTPQNSNSTRDMAVEEQNTPKLVSSGTQWTPLKPQGPESDGMVDVSTPPKMAWDEHSLEGRQIEVGTQPEPRELGVAAISSQESLPSTPKRPMLAVSYLPGGATLPVKHEFPVPELPDLDVSRISSQFTEPIMAIPLEPEPILPVEVARPLPALSLSSHSALFTEPTMPVEVTRAVPELSLSSHSAYSTEPAMPVEAIPAWPNLSLYSHSALSTEPEMPIETTRAVPELSLSSHSTYSTEPIQPQLPEVVPLPEVALARSIVPELMVSSVSSQHTQPIEPRLPDPVRELAPVVVPGPEPIIPQLKVSWLDPAFTEPVAPRPVETLPHVAPSLTTLRPVETHPVKSVPRVIPAMTDLGIQTETVEEPKGAATAVIIHEDEPSDVARSRASTTTSDRRTSTGLALSDVSGNALLHSTRQPSSYVNMDQSSQTILSSRQIDQILLDRETPRSISSADSKQTSQTREVAVVGAAGVSPFATPKIRPRVQAQSSAKSTPSYRRPDTATSQLSASSSHPPLPADHRELILAAEKRSVDTPPSPPVMGPPLAPASAYRMNREAGPRTPNEQGTRAGSARTVSTQARMRRGSQSQLSRRSSVSSFASELDERFNMNPNGGPMPHGYGPNTDPRMIQAITQTMIGEFLWKYTRKTGSGDMSSTRHRRYFWVHPYTRTLYWSEQDPQTAGKSQLRTKSVPIEAVRVVADDNPYPPGLHCRSLEVVSPGRRVRFTASTSQRHETWFNALSYLLLRETNDNCEDHDNNVTLDDIDEFNPGFRSGSRQAARMSLSSYNSRTARQNPKQQRAASAMSRRSAGTPGRASPALSSPVPNSSLQVPEERQRSSSRLSTIFNSSIRGSIASLKGRHGQSSSVHSGSIRGHDSHEDLHGADDEDRLENVRACCDGKHDVGSLSRTSRYSPRVDRMHHH